MQDTEKSATNRKQGSTQRIQKRSKQIKRNGVRV